MPTGTNLTLQFMPKALSGDKAENEEPPIENVDYHRDYGKVRNLVKHIGVL